MEDVFGYEVAANGQQTRQVEGVMMLNGWEELMGLADF